MPRPVSLGGRRGGGGPRLTRLAAELPQKTRIAHVHLGAAAALRKDIAQ